MWGGMKLNTITSNSKEKRDFAFFQKMQTLEHLIDLPIDSLCKKRYIQNDQDLFY